MLSLIPESCWLSHVGLGCLILTLFVIKAVIAFASVTSHVTHDISEKHVAKHIPFLTEQH